MTIRNYQTPAGPSGDAAGSDPAEGFDELLASSSLGAAHVRAFLDPLPEAAGARISRYLAPTGAAADIDADADAAVRDENVLAHLAPPRPPTADDHRPLPRKQAAPAPAKGPVLWTRHVTPSVRPAPAVLQFSTAGAGRAAAGRLGEEVLRDQAFLLMRFTGHGSATPLPTSDTPGPTGIEGVGLSAQALRRHVRSALRGFAYDAERAARPLVAVVAGCPGVGKSQMVKLLVLLSRWPGTPESDQLHALLDGTESCLRGSSADHAEAPLVRRGRYPRCLDALLDAHLATGMDENPQPGASSLDVLLWQATNQTTADRLRRQIDVPRLTAQEWMPIGRAQSTVEQLLREALHDLGGPVHHAEGVDRKAITSAMFTACRVTHRARGGAAPETESDGPFSMTGRDLDALLQRLASGPVAVGEDDRHHRAAPLLPPGWPKGGRSFSVFNRLLRWSLHETGAQVLLFPGHGNWHTDTALHDTLPRLPADASARLLLFTDGVIDQGQSIDQKLARLLRDDQEPSTPNPEPGTSTDIAPEHATAANTPDTPPTPRPLYYSRAGNTPHPVPPTSTTPPRAPRSGRLHLDTDTTTEGTTLRAHAAMQLLTNGRPDVALHTDLVYRSNDPYAIEMTIQAGGEPPVTWMFSRELLAEGLTRPAGEGDVRIWSDQPAPFDANRARRLHVSLDSPEGAAHLAMNLADVEEFILATRRIVAPGREHLHMADAFDGFTTPV
ncbi:SsgA family sporulation/cell division regulator [Kitasatospora aureofaciens]|uniref:SsgA family sporulation/cell division regulator n=1 Tax=Kitasatospora aureofaciens TaxID=1894 RepID=UPI0033A4BA0C